MDAVCIYGTGWNSYPTYELAQNIPACSGTQQLAVHNLDCGASQLDNVKSRRMTDLLSFDLTDLHDKVNTLDFTWVVHGWLKSI